MVVSVGIKHMAGKHIRYIKSEVFECNSDVSSLIVGSETVTERLENKPNLLEGVH